MLVEKTLFRIYDLLWAAAVPLLRKHGRLEEGFSQRTLDAPNLINADIWIQSASAGEAYLAWEILKRLSCAAPLKIMLTTNTSQGLDILLQAAQDYRSGCNHSTLQVAYFPFDRPAIMQKAVHRIQPRIMVLLESELWPALLFQLKQTECRVLIINGRITPKSLSRYLIFPSLWRRLRPNKILAISQDDAVRFARLFGTSAVDIMPNIKFDRIGGSGPVSSGENALGPILPAGKIFLILGSIRREEEHAAADIIKEILLRCPETVIGLFPRHMHRIDHWQRTLNRLAIPWGLRSNLTEPVAGGFVVLWDVFGELSLAYQKSAAAFVGGSLAPLGGQNFLEPLIHGITPVIGPFWENFSWVGKEIIDTGIIHQAASWKEVADFLIDDIMNPLEKGAVRQQALAYISARQGGTDFACRVIEESLKPEYRISNKE